MRAAAGLLCGIIFGFGLVISGMANPAKVLNFLDVAGNWDPSLAFVMAGAVVVTFIGYRLVWQADHPLLTKSFDLPSNQTISAPLVIGAVLFGAAGVLADFAPVQPGRALPPWSLGVWFSCHPWSSAYGSATSPPHSSNKIVARGMQL